MSDDLERRIESLERRTGIDAPDPPIFDVTFDAGGPSIMHVPGVRVIGLQRAPDETFEAFKERVDEKTEREGWLLRFWTLDDTSGQGIEEWNDGGAIAPELM